ncbi:hypothetical protein [Vallitalea guaymasensis]|uniref:hypothetical protein n=1 Tax=Vallitalea guaymasensis TaxID=1185412 RepID=UPI000DE26E8B|nr:hypothetical protein [Vallitalea guaymasensis]
MFTAIPTNPIITNSVKEHVSLILIAFSALTCYNILYNEEQKELSDIKKKILGQESMNCEELKSTIYFLEKTYESNIIGNQTVSDISGVIQI